MCTLTLFPLGPGRVRVAFNRDESWSRPPALPPQQRRYGARTALLPVDPVSTGTWIAVNDAGLMLALLNANPPIDAAGCRRRGRASRGAIIPSLLACGTPIEALEQLARSPVTHFAPFRLVLASVTEVAQVHFDGERFTRQRPAPLSAPLLWTSSGLGDHLVEERRRQLFEDFLSRPGDQAARQDAFHQHRWPGQPHVSVCMRRADAGARSYTVVEFNESAAVLTYCPAAPDQSVPSAMARLPFQQVGVR